MWGRSTPRHEPVPHEWDVGYAPEQDWKSNVVLALIVLALGAVTIIVAALWPWRVWIALGVLVLSGLLGGLRVLMAWQNHQADLEIKRNQALIPVAGDQGFAYVEDGRVRGYSHAGVPAYPMLEGPGMDGREMDQQPDYPRTFVELVKGRHIGPGADFVLGFDEVSGEPLTMPNLTSLGIGGGQGFGKTTTAHLIMLESVVKFNGRIKFLELDPHINVDDEDTLYSKTKDLEPFFMQHNYLPNPVGLVGHEDEVDRWVDVWMDEFNRRMQGGKGPYWVLVMDEGAAVFDSSVGSRISKLIENINRQARKVRMFAIIISQEWRASRVGGSEGRNAIVTFLLHNMTESTAELLVPSDVAHQTARLKKGEAILYTEGRDRKGMVPQASEEDARMLVELFYPQPEPDYSIKEIGAGPKAIQGEFLELPLPGDLPPLPGLAPNPFRRQP